MCPPGCQALIDQLYSDCDGVTTPDGLFFDPANAIEGAWSDKVSTVKYIQYALAGVIIVACKSFGHCAIDTAMRLCTPATHSVTVHLV